MLSLFFIDRVEHYRTYGEDGSRALGRYGVIFEQEYRKLAAHPDYRSSLFLNVMAEPDRAHDGYFSMDRRVVSPFEEHQLKKTASAEAVATDSFNLIMRQKEQLLDEAEPLPFHFLPFGPARRVGQSQCLPNMRLARNGRRIGASADRRPRIATVCR